jgi:tripartite-type tricarboxylate transporter receptor subunit TctC
MTAMRSLAVMLAAFFATPALAQDLAAVWRGKTVTILAGMPPGGGYDLYARLLGRHFGKHIPGNPQVVVQNMVGASSLAMAAHVANVAPRDGTIIGAAISTLPLAPVLDDPASLRFDATKFNYIGSGNEDAFLCIVGKDSPVQKFEDAFSTEVIMGGSSETGTTGYMPVLLSNVLGVKLKTVFGYPGTRDLILAIQRREVQGQCAQSWGSMISQYADLLKSGAVKLFLQESLTGHPEMDRLGVPRAGDFAKTDEQRAILEIVYSQSVSGRPYFVGPGVAPERIEALRKAFMDAWKDPELLAEAEKLNAEIGPVDGARLQAVLGKIYASPEELKLKAREAIKVKR